MKINQASKFVPNLFYHAPPANQDYIDIQTTLKTPFQEITNTQPKNNRKNSSKKNRQPRSFLNDDDEIQPHLDIESEQPFKVLEQTVQDAEIVQNENVNCEKLCINKKPNILLDFDYQENSDQYLQQNQQSNPTAKEVNSISIDIEMPMIAHRLDKLTLLDWSNSSQNQGIQTVKIIEQDRCEVAEQKIKQQIKLTQSIQEIKMSFQTVFERVKTGAKMQCLIRRDKKNINGIPEYNIYFQKTLKHILTVRKQGMWQYCFYLRDSVPGGKFNHTKIATMQSSFLGNKFTLIKHKQKYSEMTVCYDTNILGLSGPRRLQIYLPRTKIPYEYLNECYDDKKWMDKIQKCVSKTAKWNQKFKSYVLNLHGRASQSSIKNFVITDADQMEENSYLIFGKAGTDVYNLDIQRPFSIIQGVAAAITSFQRKLTCD